MKKLTNAEEQVMKVLWHLQCGFLMEIVTQMPAPAPHKNTVATVLKVLIEKEFVRTETFGRNFKYFPTVTHERYSRTTLKQIAKSYFNGSFTNIVSFLIRKNELTVDEIEQLLEEVKKAKK